MKKVFLSLIICVSSSLAAIAQFASVDITNNLVGTGVDIYVDIYYSPSTSCSGSPVYGSVVVPPTGSPITFTTGSNIPGSSSMDLIQAIVVHDDDFRVFPNICSLPLGGFATTACGPAATFSSLVFKDINNSCNASNGTGAWDPTAFPNPSITIF